jgi:hypothetical protein
MKNDELFDKLENAQVGQGNFDRTRQYVSELGEEVRSLQSGYQKSILNEEANTNNQLVER